MIYFVYTQGCSVEEANDDILGATTDNFRPLTTSSWINTISGVGRGWIGNVSAYARFQNTE